MALSQANLIGQKGFEQTQTWVLFQWRPEEGRLNHLLNESKIQITHRGFVRGASILIDNFAITKTEAQHAAILEIDFNLKNYHNKNYRSDQAFRTGASRNFGHQINPSCFPSTPTDREHVATYLCWQGLSTLGDRADYDFGEELSDEKRKAMKYFWHSELYEPTMVASTMLYNNLSKEHRKAYAMIDFDMSSSIPKFISEFHLDQFKKALKYIFDQQQIFRSMAEMD